MSDNDESLSRRPSNVQIGALMHAARHGDAEAKAELRRLKQTVPDDPRDDL